MLQRWEPREGTSFALRFQRKKSCYLTFSSLLVSKEFREFRSHDFTLSFEVYMIYY